MKDLCQKCKSKPAVFYYEQNINGQKSRCALCADCATEWKHTHKLNEDFLFSSGELSPFSNLDAIFGSVFAPSGITTRKKCPLCESTFNDLKRSGKIGCAQCYETFAEELAPSLRSLYGSQKHTGRAPAALATETQKKKQIEELKKQMNRAVETQAYEEAAKLRDQIREIEKDM